MSFSYLKGEKQKQKQKWAQAQIENQQNRIGTEHETPWSKFHFGIRVETCLKLTPGDCGS